MERFLLFLSKTDQAVVRRCPPIARNIQASLGFFVLLTGIVAFLSGTYAISNIFIHEDSASGELIISLFGWPAAVAFGLVYAAFIMAIDRDIVAASNKLAVLSRLPLAVLISLIISKPIEMQLFDAAIVKQLTTDSQNQQHNKQLSDKLAGNVKLLQQQYNTLDSNLRAAVKSWTYWQNLRTVELVGTPQAGATGNSGPGPAYRLADENMKAQQMLIDRYNVDLKEVKSELDKAKADEDTRYQKSKDKQSYDLLSKSIALEEVKNGDKSGAANRMGWGITALFLLFETIPSLIKLLLPKSEYDALIDKRRLLNILAANMIYEEATSIYHNKSAEEISIENPIRINQLYLSQSD